MPDREKVIKGLESCVNGESCISGCPYFKEVPMTDGRCITALQADALAMLKEQESGGWISVKDAMPERQTPVLVYVPPYSDENEEFIGHVAMSYYTYSARGGYWAGTDGNVYGAIGIIHDPTYWMPLPEPPKEVTGDE